MEEKEWSLEWRCVSFMVALIWFRYEFDRMTLFGAGILSVVGVSSCSRRQPCFAIVTMHEGSFDSQRTDTRGSSY